jgi:integrase
LLLAKWLHVDRSKRELLIPAANCKSKEDVRVPLHDDVFAILDAMPSRPGVGSPEDGSGWLFPSHGKSEHIADPNVAWKRIRERASVNGIDVSDIHLHDLRHDFATELLRRGVSGNAVLHLLGDRDPKMLAVYGNPTPDDLRAATASAAPAMSVSVMPEASADCEAD